MSVTSDVVFVAVALPLVLMVMWLQIDIPMAKLDTMSLCIDVSCSVCGDLIMRAWCSQG